MSIFDIVKKIDEECNISMSGNEISIGIAGKHEEYVFTYYKDTNDFVIEYCGEVISLSPKMVDYCLVIMKEMRELYGRTG